jgi:hypothetical protein
MLVVSACGNVASSTTTTAATNDSDAADALANATDVTVTVTVTPSEGPSGTNAPITVTGQPNQIVFVQVSQPNGFEYQLSGTTDAGGNFTDTGSFSGRVSDVITITAIVGPTQDSPSSSTMFTITGTDETTTTSSTTTTTTAATTTTTQPPTTTITVASVGFSGSDVTGSINPGAAAVGQTIHLSACGLQPGEAVEWSFLGLLVQGTADGEGCIELSMTIPAGTPAESHPMDLSGDQGSFAELDYATL